MKTVYTHPYKAYFPHKARGLIVGTAPGHRYSASEKPQLLEGDLDFFYGSFYNRFWPVMKRVFEPESISWLRTGRQCRDFLQRHDLAIGDIILEFHRIGRYAGDENVKMIVPNLDLIHRLARGEQIDYVYFTSHEALRLFRKSIYTELLYRIETYTGSEMPGADSKDLFDMKLYNESGAEYRQLTLIVLRSPSPRGVDALALLEDYQTKFAPFTEYQRD